MLGMTAEQETSKKVGAKRNQGPMYPGSDLTDLDVWVSGDNNGAYGGQSSWGFVSYLGRVNYVYDDKYSIELLGRRDGSSKFVQGTALEELLFSVWVLENLFRRVYERFYLVERFESAL